MQKHFKLYWVIVSLLLTLASCGPLRLIIPPLTRTPKSVPTALSGPVTFPPETGFGDLHMFDQNTGIAYRSYYRTIRTTDGGLTWKPVFWGEETIITYLDSQTAWGQVLSETNGQPILHTSDGGQTWTQISYAPNNGPSVKYPVFHFSDALNGWTESMVIGAEDREVMLSETRDGGKTWAPIQIKVPPNAVPGLPAGTILLPGPAYFYYDPGRIIIIDKQGWSTENSPGAVSMQVSLDMGNTWQSQSLPLPKKPAGARLLYPSRPYFSDVNGILPILLEDVGNHGWMFNYRYTFLMAFYATQDGGASWSLRPGVATGYYWSDEPTYQDFLYNFVPSFGSFQDIFILCRSNAVCVSHDEAKTWQTIPFKPDFTRGTYDQPYSLDFINANTGWVLLEHWDKISNIDRAYIFKTTDGGGTWTQIIPREDDSTWITVYRDASLPTPTPVPPQNTP